MKDVRQLKPHKNLSQSPSPRYELFKCFYIWKS